MTVPLGKMSPEMRELRAMLWWLWRSLQRGGHAKQAGDMDAMMFTGEMPSVSDVKNWVRANPERANGIKADCR